AEAALPAWRARTAADRARLLRRLFDLMLEHQDALGDLLSREQGKPLAEARGEIAYGASFIEWFAEEGKRAYGEVIPPHAADRRIVTLRQPVGVVAAITPWNFPNQINLAKIGPALAAGCTVVLKPAPDTPLIAAAVARIAAEETDIPAGVLNVVSSSDHGVGAQLTSDPRVDLVSFTGSTATGKKIMVAAAETLKKVFLELGGKSAAVVLDDADLNAACFMTALNACTHAGQGCALTTRLVVPRERYDEAVQSAKGAMAAFAPGDPTDPGTLCGPLISELQRERVEGYIALAVEEGGTIEIGGGRPADKTTGYFIEPTLISGLDNSSRVAQEEIFGPVLVVIPHDGDEDAVRIANDSPYGLSGAVWGSDLERVEKVVSGIRTGTLGVNGGIWYGADVPFGGYKQSGIGREMGRQGFEEYLETKAVATPA
ncbi:MAG TPA: aldehyde dehydrogenase family protein, partial [Dietzia sp.]|nr:aldehyde dehydrogenase family protein [Dietzia sp.]